jgi:hypothetical protein
MGRGAKVSEIQEADLKGWKLVARFRELLAEARQHVPAKKREEHGLRCLEAEEYLSLFLLGLFNSVITSMRGLCAASALPRVQAECGGDGPVALARFSEAQKVFAPELLEHVLTSLVEESWGQAGASVGGLDPKALHIIDSTLWKVVPRMGWAQYGGGRGGQTKGVRLHLKMRVVDQVPLEAIVTPGKACERKTLARHLRPGQISIGDRYYGADYHLLSVMEAKGCGFLMRLRAQAIQTLEREAALSAEDRAAGVVSARWVRLGAADPQGPWRVIRLERPEREPILLVASSQLDGLSPAELAELYRQRWQVELFFRWLKCLLPCRHFFAESERGVKFQVYLSLICALLLSRVAQRRPSKRIMEMIRFHQMGWADEADLARALARELARPPRKKHTPKNA